MENTMELEIAANDLDCEKINFYDFQRNLPTSLEKNGWRLPTLDELKKMYQMHKENQLNFKNDWYMTSEGDHVDSWCMHFSDGECSRRDHTEDHWGLCYVRLVKG